MKKSLIIAAALAISSVSGFSQGNVAFGGIVHGIYTATTGTWTASTGDDVAWLFYASNPTTTLNGIFSGAATGSATNAVAGNNSAFSQYNTATAWTALLTGAIAVNNPAGTAPAVGNITGTLGTFTYNGGVSYTASNVGDGTGGITYFCVEVAWNPGTGGDSTLAAASANGDLVGWSKVFSYTPTSGSVTPTTLSSSLVGYYGVGGVITATPEPSTMALAALGGASLLLFRRRK